MLAAGVPDEYERVLANAKQIPQDLPQLERTAFGPGYPEIGAQLLRHWRIPEPLCIAVENFRNVDGAAEVSELAKLLHVGEIAAGVICPDTKGGPPDPHAFVEAASRLFGILPDRCSALLTEISTEIENTRAMLEMPKGGMRSIDEIQSEVRERIAELSLAMHLEVQTMANQQEELLKQAATDALTGIANRAAFNARLSLELAQAARSGTPLALLMIDIDSFKAFNDTYGHQAGDHVIRCVAQALDTNIRKVDFAARYGGEEFAVIAPEAKPDGVRGLAERLRRSVSESPVSWEHQSLLVTISVGFTTCRDVTDSTKASEIVRAADTQLYAAKNAGRNCVKGSIVAGAALETVGVEC